MTTPTSSAAIGGDPGSDATGRAAAGAGGCEPLTAPAVAAEPGGSAVVRVVFEVLDPDGDLAVPPQYDDRLVGRELDFDRVRIKTFHLSNGCRRPGTDRRQG